MGLQATEEELLQEIVEEIVNELNEAIYDLYFL